MTLQLPTEPKLASKVIDANIQQETKRIDRGWFGIVFGSGAEKSGNLAGIVLLVLLAAVIGIIFGFSGTQDLSKKDALTMVLGILTTVLGFIFGKATS